jgi:hypothetical protein
MKSLTAAGNVRIGPFDAVIGWLSQGIRTLGNVKKLVGKPRYPIAVRTPAAGGISSNPANPTVSLF